jgi:hypothetical protein
MMYRPFFSPAASSRRRANGKKLTPEFEATDTFKNNLKTGYLNL